MSRDLPRNQRTRLSLVIVTGLLVGLVAWIGWRAAGIGTPVIVPTLAAEKSHLTAQPQANILSKCDQLWTEQRGDELVESVREWLTTPAHPEPEVIAWLFRLPSDARRDALFAALAPELPVARRLDLAMAALSPGAHRDLLSAALGEWASKDAPAAVQWLSKHPSDPSLNDAQAAIAIAWSDEHPREAATYVATAMTEGQHQDRAAIAIVQRWAQQDAPSAARWVETLPQDHLEITAAEELTRIWSEDDPGTAEGWVQQLPPGPMRDHSLSSLARFLAPSNPAKASFWATQISNAKVRSECLSTLPRQEGK